MIVQKIIPQAPFFLFLLLASLFANADEMTDRFIDPLDGGFDVSHHLLKYSGFLPVPIIITEPAVGYGGGVALVFFRDSLAEVAERHKLAGERMMPPDIGAILAFKTENGSEGAGGGYFGTLGGDRFRYTIAAAEPNMNLDYYGYNDVARSFAIKAPFVYLQGLARVAESDWLLGLNYFNFSSDVDFGIDVPPTIRTPDLDATIGRVSLVAEYDSRDNVLTPLSGSSIRIERGYARENFGGSSDFDILFMRSYSYLPIGKDYVFGLRLDGKTSDGDVPFFAKPYISMRGIPAMRYQGDSTVLSEMELRYHITARWDAVGFAGVGKAFGGRTDYDEAETITAGGAGFRYFIARQLGLYAGLDVAAGPEEAAIYIQVGSAWR